MDDKTINASASIPSVFNKKMVDAFMQTDKMNRCDMNRCDMNPNGCDINDFFGVGGLEKENHTLKQILEMEAVMKVARA